MDVYSGSGSTRTQIHDYHIQSLSAPFVADTDAAFWTVQVPDTSIRISPLGEFATVELLDLPVSDSFQVMAPMNLPAKAILRVTWLPGLASRTDRSPRLGFAGVFQPAAARMDFATSGPTSATEPATFTFRTGIQDQETDFAQVGREVNGVFLTGAR